MNRAMVALLSGVAALSAGAVSSQAAPRPVIIDTDPGTDDAMAILLGLNSPELDVRAFTVVGGNVPQAQALENALRLVSLAGRCDIPIARGAPRPLAQRLITAEFVHGQNGLGDADDGDLGVEQKSEGEDRGSLNAQ